MPASKADATRVSACTAETGPSARPSSMRNVARGSQGQGPPAEGQGVRGGLGRVRDPQLGLAQVDGQAQKLTPIKVPLHQDYDVR